MNPANKTNYTVALIGNPNVGKTTIFNALTGAHQTVGNWPGVTVEHKVGSYSYNEIEFKVIDLPGIYSLTAGTPDEKVTRDYILNENPDLLINVVDAANLERNLYLSLQLIEMKVPVIIMLTMLDIAEQNRIVLQVPHLASHLDLPVFAYSTDTRIAEAALNKVILSAAAKRQVSGLHIKYDLVVDEAIDRLLTVLNFRVFPMELDQHWLCLKLLEKDEHYSRMVEDKDSQIIRGCHKAIEKHRAQSCPNVIADDRYGFIHGLVTDVVSRQLKWERTFSDAVDRVVLSSGLGLPIFFFVMFLVFSLTIKVSQPIVGWISTGLGWLLLDQLGMLWRWLHLPLWLADFITNGIGAGVITVATFIPPIFFIFASLAFLEDSGYMSRAAFVADKIMRRIGLPGKAFIPLLVGFGCTVPAIMATRTLETKRDRVLASLLTSFMSCGAKLPVYTFLAMIFFPGVANLVVFGLYMLGILLAMLTGLLLKQTLFKSQPSDFVMELPAYHLPTMNGILMHTWHRLRDFVLRAGQTILGVIALMYALQMIYIPTHWHSPLNPAQEPKRITLLEATGKAINPIFRPMGIRKENWHASVALVSGVFAKEAIVGSLQTLYIKRHNETISATVKRHFGSNSAGFAYLLFILLYSPCAAALTMLWKEHGKGWTGFAFVYLTSLAWMLATLFYQISQIRVDAETSLMWIAITLGMGLAGYLILQFTGKKMKHEA